MSYQFKPGDTGLCRDGTTTYEVLKKLENGFIVVLLQEANFSYRCHMYTCEGLDGIGRYYDLMPPKHKIEFWVNVYPDGGMRLWRSKLDADCAGGGGQERTACLHIVREFEPGEGL